MSDEDLELIEAYLDGLLNADERHAFDRRLAEAAFRQAVADSRALREALRLAKPEVPTAKMWSQIQAQLGQERASAPWMAWLSRPWSWPLRGALAGSLAALAVMVLQPWKAGQTLQEQAVPEVQRAKEIPAEAKAVGQDAGKEEPSQASADRPAAAPLAAKTDDAPGASRESASASSYADEQPSKRSMARPVVAAPEATLASAAPAVRSMAPSAAAPAAKTEVERALEATELDGMIQAILEAQAKQPRTASASRAVRNDASSFEPALSRTGAGASLASASSGLRPSEMAEATANTELAPQGGIDPQGFWDWRPAALALNRRQWAQAQADLGLAQGNAPEAAERAFAASALSLLSSGGGPLTAPGFTVQPGPLLVQQAGRWQLLVERRRAVYEQGVIARLPGWRTQGKSLVLDLSLDRGDFAAGTRFTRLADDAPARLYDAQGQVVAVEDVLAGQGATYSVGKKELHLK